MILGSATPSTSAVTENHTAAVVCAKAQKSDGNNPGLSSVLKDISHYVS